MVYKFYFLIFFIVLIHFKSEVSSTSSHLTNFLQNSFNNKINQIEESSSKPINKQLKDIPNIASRLGESVVLECGKSEHELLKQLESTEPSMPVLVNWFKHYSLTRRSDKPIYAKYLANNIDYAPHISRDYENRLQVIDKINLNISNLKAVDEALYECRLILFDKAYADSQTGSMFYLQVHVPPEFEYPNEEIVYFKPNIPIRLYCYARGKPQPTITWYKNGVKLDANTSVLQETFSSHDDALDIFEYRCKVENIVGQIEHTVKVIKSGSLFFTEPLKNLTVAEGTILNWPCLAQSNADITYKWFKDSISVQSHLHKWSDRGALFQDGMLYLLETYRNDSGFYECHAFTANKRIETSAYLNVLYGPEITPFQSPLYGLEGSQSVILDCVVKSNPSVITLEWFKDKYLLSNNHKYQILPNNSLLIRNLQKSDKGQYFCTCNNTLKKVVSPLIKLEVIDSKKAEIHTLYTSHAQSSFKLPCRALLLSESQSSEVMDQIQDPNDVKWFKINSKLPSNRYLIDSNGSLIIQNVRMSDSGVYYCKVDEQVRVTLYQQNKNKTRSSNEEKYGQNEKLIRLNVIQNKTTSNALIPSKLDAIDQSNEIYGSDEEITNEVITELPPTPENLKLNLTNNGILVSWNYSNKQQSAKIEYFQIYFRELNEKTTSNFNHEWKTTDPIQSNQNSFFIDESNLIENQVYEFQIVAFSLFSKSLPSTILKFKYSPKDLNVIPRGNLNTNSNVFIHHNNLLDAHTFSLSKLSNMSHLDSILVTIFLILVFILIISIIACVVYRRSFRSKKKGRNSKKNADLDDWGFQSTAATTTFLPSSSSSSEKSLDLNSKTERNSTFDCDLNKSKNQNKQTKTSKCILTTSNQNKNKNNNASLLDENETESFRLNSSKVYTNINNARIKLRDINNKNNYYDDEIMNKNEYDEDFNDEDDEDRDYYYKKKTNSIRSTGSKKIPTVSNQIYDINKTLLNKNNNKTILNNNNSGTSSGITSDSNCTSNSSEYSMEIQVPSNEASAPITAVNKIKYNAKTNVLQQEHFNTLSPTKPSIMKYNKDPKFNTLINKNGLNSKNIKILKFNANGKDNILECNTAIDNSTNTTDVSTTTSGINNSPTSNESVDLNTKKSLQNDHDEYDYDNKYDVYCYASNDSGGGMSGVSFSVDNNTSVDHHHNGSDLMAKFNDIYIKNQELNNNANNNNVISPKSKNGNDYWPNDETSLSMTPVDSSTYSNTSISPPLTQSINNQNKLNYQQITSISQTLENNKNLMPFPMVNNGNYQKSFLKLNSGSSLTMVSKVPSTAYGFYGNNNNNMDEIDNVGRLYGTTASSTSSGCSSLENPNQYYTKTYTCGKNQIENSYNYSQNLIDEIKEKIIRPNNNNNNLVKPTRAEIPVNYNQRNNYTNYRPVLKSSFSNNNNNTPNEKKQIILQNNLNNNVANVENNSTFKNQSKIDYV